MPAWGDIRAAGEALLDEVGEVVGVFDRGNDDAVGGNDLSEGGREDGRACANQLVAEDDLLLTVKPLRLDEGELGGAGKGR